MGAESGPKDSALRGGKLERRLRDRPYEFEFFQAVVLLERLLDGVSPVGRFGEPAAEAARFAARPSIAFPAAEIQSLSAEPGSPARVEVNFMGLTGALGVMPTPYTVLMIERLRHGDRAMRDFFDLFNHRLISLFHRAWEKYRPGIAYERGEDDRFSHYLLDLIGLGTPALQDRQAVPDRSLLYYAGLFAQFPRSADGLERIVSGYFGVPAEVLCFAGTWRPLDLDSQTCLLDGATESEQLGVGAVLGDEVWDQQSVVRLRLGPLTLEEYRDFLPEGSAYEPLKAIARFYCGEDLDVEVQLVLKREEAPRCALDAEETVEPRLGWISWMFTRPLDRDPDETVLRLWESEESR